MKKIFLLFTLLLFSCSSSPKSPFVKNQLRNYNSMVLANKLVQENDFKAAFKLYEKACYSFASNDDLEGLVECRINSALAYLKKGEKNKAKKSLNEAKNISTEFQLLDYQGKVYLNLAFLDIKEKKWQSSIELLSKSIKLLQRNSKDPETINKAKSYLGYVFLKTGKLDNALKVLNEAYDTENENIKSYVCINLAQFYLEKNFLDKALEFASQAKDIDKKEAYSSYLELDYYYLAKIYFKKKNSTKALYYAKRGFYLALLLKRKKSIFRFSQLLLGVFQQKNDKKNVQYYKKMIKKYR